MSSSSRVLSTSMNVLAATTVLVTAVFLGEAAGQTSDPVAGSWRQWGGPTRDFMSEAVGLADSWNEDGPPVVWTRPLGLGHSSIVVDGGVLYTMYRRSDESARRGGRGNRGGGVEASEVVIAMDAATGETKWEYEYPSEPLNFRFGAGPHSTPLVVGDLVFTVGTNKQMHALTKETGALVWSLDLIDEYGAPPTLIRPAVQAGYGGNPLAFEDTIILQAGGEGQAVMALRQRDGALVWRNGDFLIANAAPLLIDVDGQQQVVIVGGQTINGLDPTTGEILWSHPHDTDGDMNNTMPLWGPDNVLFVSSAYNQGSRALKLTRQGADTNVEELWFTGRMKLMFVNAIRIGDFVYGTDGGFGPAFLTALDINTGAAGWQERGFGRSSLVHADGKVFLLDEDGDLVLGRVSPTGFTTLSRAHIFDTTAWTVPTVVGTTLYARDREKIVALDVGR
jgi:outer membrane protein assembly factor BamB